MSAFEAGYHLGSVVNSACDYSETTALDASEWEHHRLYFRT